MAEWILAYCYGLSLLVDAIISACGCYYFCLHDVLVSLSSGAASFCTLFLPQGKPCSWKMHIDTFYSYCYLFCSKEKKLHYWKHFCLLLYSAINSESLCDFIQNIFIICCVFALLFHKGNWRAIDSKERWHSRGFEVKAWSLPQTNWACMLFFKRIIFLKKYLVPLYMYILKLFSVLPSKNWFYCLRIDYFLPFKYLYHQLCHSSAA